MFQTYGLCHLNIPVSDLQRTVGFYAGLFGMTEIRRFEDCVMLRTPNTHEVLTLTRNADKAKQMTKQEDFHFGFRLTELVDMNEILNQAMRLGGSSPTQGGAKEKGRVWASVKDPDGYDVEIFWENG